VVLAEITESLKTRRTIIQAPINRNIAWRRRMHTMLPFDRIPSPEQLLQTALSLGLSNHRGDSGSATGCRCSIRWRSWRADVKVVVYKCAGLQVDAWPDAVV